MNGFFPTQFADTDQRLLYARVDGVNLGYCDSPRNRTRKVSLWAFFHQVGADTPRKVGREYPSRETLLADMDRYGRDFGF
jgi:hypothetical protein